MGGIIGFILTGAFEESEKEILGLPNSGIPSAYSVFSFDSANAVNGFAYDTAFGIEGSIMAVILLAVACAALYLIGSKRKAK